MKRFMKACGMMALIFALLGFPLAVLGGFMAKRGGMERVLEEAIDSGYFPFPGGGVRRLKSVKEISELREDTIVIEEPADIGSIEAVEGIDGIPEEVWGESVVEGTEDGQVLEFADDSHAVGFEDGRRIYTGDVEKFCLGSGVQELKLDLGGCSFHVIPSDDGFLYLEATDIYKLQVFVDGDALCVSASERQLHVLAGSVGTIVLYLPEGQRFREAEISLGAGWVEMFELYADKASLEIGAGTVDIADAEVGGLEVSVGAGEVSFGQLEVESLKADVNMGGFAATGRLLGDADIQCAMGGVALLLEGRKEDFDYKLSCAMGSIDFEDGESYSLVQEKKIDNRADKEMDIECAMGSVSLSFME